MKIFNFKKMKGGCFVGDFLPTAFKTKTLKFLQIAQKK